MALHDKLNTILTEYVLVITITTKTFLQDFLKGFEAAVSEFQ